MLVFNRVLTKKKNIHWLQFNCKKTHKLKCTLTHKSSSHTSIKRHQHGKSKTVVCKVDYKNEKSSQPSCSILDTIGLSPSGQCGGRHNRFLPPLFPLNDEHMERGIHPCNQQQQQLFVSCLLVFCSCSQWCLPAQSRNESAFHSNV